MYVQKEAKAKKHLQASRVKIATSLLHSSHCPLPIRRPSSSRPTRQSRPSRTPSHVAASTRIVVRRRLMATTMSIIPRHSRSHIWLLPTVAPWRTHRHLNSSSPWSLHLLRRRTRSRSATAPKPLLDPLLRRQISTASSRRARGFIGKQLGSAGTASTGHPTDRRPLLVRRSIPDVAERSSRLVVCGLGGGGLAATVGVTERGGGGVGTRVLRGW